MSYVEMENADDSCTPRVPPAWFDRGNLQVASVVLVVLGQVVAERRHDRLGQLLAVFGRVEDVGRGAELEELPS